MLKKEEPRRGDCRGSYAYTERTAPRRGYNRACERMPGGYGSFLTFSWRSRSQQQGFAGFASLRIADRGRSRACAERSTMQNGLGSGTVPRRSPFPMRWRGQRESENIEDRRGEGGGFGSPFPGGLRFPSGGSGRR